MVIYKKIFFFSILSVLLYSMMGADIGRQSEQIYYNASLHEMVQELEYVYEMMNIPSREVMDYGELGELPGNTFEVSIYMLEGNKLLFLPTGKGNSEIWLGNLMHEVYYSDTEKGYLFYAVEDWGLEESGVPVNYFGSRRMTYLTVGKGREKGYCLNDLEWIGKADVDFSDKETGSLWDIQTIGDEYINVLLDEVSNVLREKQKYGEYDIYIGRFRRVSGKDGDTSCLLDFVIVGNGIREAACFVIYDTGDIDGGFSLSGPRLQNTGYFTDLLGKECEDLVSEIIKWRCEPVHLDVREEMEPYANRDTVTVEYCISTMDFRDMSTKDLAELIGNLCSYCEWYGMKELGCQEKLGELNGREMVLYSWENNGDTLFFIPMDETNVVLQGKNGMEYPLCVNENGNIVFYKMTTNPYAHTGWIKTTFIAKEELSVYFMDNLLKLGEEMVEIRSFPDLGFPKAEVDEYTQALREYVEEMLRENGKHGKYDIYMGEYESVGPNKVCMSAAVTGEEEYYVRYLVVKYGEGDFYFWPVGFGLDGSLGECASEKHRMNKICIERVRQLDHKL